MCFSKAQYIHNIPNLYICICHSQCEHITQANPKELTQLGSKMATKINQGGAIDGWIKKTNEFVS